MDSLSPPYNVLATKNGLRINGDTLSWNVLDKARAIATNTPTIERLMTLLEHAVKEADGYHDDSRGGPIQDDELMDEARNLLQQ